MSTQNLTTALIIWLVAVYCQPVLGQKKSDKSKKLSVTVVDKPKMKWISHPDDSTKVEYNLLVFEAEIQSRTELKVVELSLNDIIVDKYLSFTTDQGKFGIVYKTMIKNSLNLRPGLNTIRLSATNVNDVEKVEDHIVVSSMTQLTVLENTNDKNPPQIFVANPPNIRDDFVRYSGDIIKVRGTVIDDSGVKTLKINSIKTPIQTSGNYMINLPLAMGENPITIESEDINGNIALKKFTILRRDLRGVAYAHEKANNYVIAIGINDYTNWRPLNNAVNDVEAITSTLTEYYEFNDVNVTTLTNEQATRENIYSTLRSYIEKVTPQDNLIIYYSGHGYFDELLNEGYWVPVNARKNEVDYLPNSTLLNIIKNIDSQHTLLIADACFSGSLFSASNRGYIENVERYKSRWGLASGRLEVVSDGEIGENSPFATSLNTYLLTVNKDKFSATELIQFMKIDVADKTNQTPIGNPLKGAGDEGGEFIFYKRK